MAGRLFDVKMENSAKKLELPVTVISA